MSSFRLLVGSVLVAVVAALFAATEPQAISPAKDLFERLPRWNGEGEPPVKERKVYRDPATDELLIFVPGLAAEQRAGKLYRFRPQNQVAPDVAVTVNRNDNSYVYSYRLGNGPGAKAILGMWGVVGPGRASDVQLAHPRWRPGRSPKTVAKGRFSILPETGEFLFWFGDEGDRLRPGVQDTSSFTIRSDARPGITTAYAGALDSIKTEYGLPGDIAIEVMPFTNWDAETVYLPAIGPKYRPDTPARVIAEDYIAGLKELSEVNWISARSQYYRDVVAMLQSCPQSQSPKCESPLFALPAPEGRFEQELAQAIWISLR